MILCNDCEKLQKCECCGKPINHMDTQIAKAIEPIATKPLIPAIPMDEERIPADKPIKPLLIKPVEELNNLTDVFMKGW